MKTFISLCIALLLLSAFYTGCKDDKTDIVTPPPGVDFTITYQIHNDTCYFLFSPSLDVHLDSIRSQYPAQSYSFIWHLSPAATYHPSINYYFDWWYLMPRPANWTFTFWGRKVSDNSNFTVTKDFTVP